MQAGVHRYRDLEINQNLAFEKRSWMAERVGWTVMAVAIVAALLGLFGVQGLLSETTVAHPSAPFRLTYHRFARYVAPTSLVFEIAPGAAQSTGLTVWLSCAYLEHVKIEGIVPPPLRVETTGDRILFIFAAPDAGQPAYVRFDLQAASVGKLRGEAGLAQGSPLRFDTFVYP